MEEWRDIPGYEDYQISSFGHVRHKKNMIHKKLTLCKSNGYYLINLHHNNVKYLHRLLALAFIPNPENKPTVDHINRNKIDNRIDNLRWTDMHEQNKNKYHQIGRSGYKNITLFRNSYQVRITGKERKYIYCKTFPTLPEAIEARNTFLATI